MKFFRVFIGATLLALFLWPGDIKAQETLKGVYEKKEIKKNEPLPYQHLREADVMWSKTIWRIIDLREKMNLPLYYPTEPIGDRKSLIDLLLEGIMKKGTLTAFSADQPNEEFSMPIKQRDIYKKFDLVETEEDEVPGPEAIPSDEVKQIIVKELWFFDKQRSVLETRIIGLCPIRWFYREEDVDREEPQKRKLFWVYYPRARDFLAKNPVYNPKNDAEYRSYDAIFQKRYFDSYIVRQSNTYNNRRIRDYTSGVDALYEGKQISKKIFNFEQDLWSY